MKKCENYYLYNLNMVKCLYISPSLAIQVEGEFAHLPPSSPSCVVVGDAGEAFTFHALNEAFRTLKDMDSPKLYALGCG